MAEPPIAPRFDPERYAPRAAKIGALLVVVALILADRIGIVVGLSGAALLLLSAYSRRDGLLLLGPLATRELVRAARRRRLYVWRVVFVLATLVYLASVYEGFAGGYNRLFFDATIPVRHAARAAEDVFFTFVLAAVVVAVGGTVVLLPPVIAEEREANRLDHLLVTDLRAREIILGKLAARFAVLAGYIALVLPVLAALTWFGGVDPDRVALTAGMTAVGLLGLCGLALAVSSDISDSAAAVVLAVVVAVELFGLTLMCFGLPFAVAWLAARGWVPAGWIDPSRGVGHFLSAGNPVTSAIRLGEARRAGGDEVTILCHYAAWHAAMLFGGWALAVSGLRKEVRPRTPGTAAPSPARVVPVRPPVSDEPITWHDVTIAIPGRQPNPTRFERWAERFLVAAAVVVSGVVLGVGWFIPDGRKGLGEFAAMTGFFAVLGVTLPAAFIACRGVPRERERGMLDALRLTALTPADILAQKWQAAVALTRPLFLFAAAVWALFTLAGGLHPGGLVMLCAATAANRYLAVSVGQWVGLSAATPVRAVGRLAGFAVLYAYAAWLAVGPLSWIGVNPRPFYFVIVPPAGQCFAGAAFQPEVPARVWGPGVDLLTAATGLAFCAAASRLAWRSACRRFDRMMTPAPDAIGGPPT